MIRHMYIRPFEIGLRFHHDAFAGLVEPGAHWLFDPLGRERIEIVDQRAPFLEHKQLDLIIRSGVLEGRALVLDLPGQEVLTADRVTLRLTAVGVYKVVDPVRAVTATDDAKQALYREVQLAVRASVGVRTLDALLADKTALAAELTETAKAKA